MAAARDGRTALTHAGPRAPDAVGPAGRYERLMTVPEDLPCLEGHFPGVPVVPGVAQLGWVLDAARDVLGAPPTVEVIETLKFKRLLRPADVFRLGVELAPDRRALTFRLWDDGGVISSGRLRLATRGMWPCLLIPIFDHGATIGGVVDQLRPLELPCIVVNDGSGRETTATLSRLAATYPWVHVEHLQVNRGRGAALRHGYRAARARGFSHVVQLDADGQHDPADVVRLLQAAEAHPNAVVLGDPRFDATAPWARRYGRKISQAIVWAYTGSFAIHDPLCGFRCFPLEPTLAVLERHRLGDRMEFDPEIVVRLAWQGLPIVNVPVHVRYFAGGRSHFRLVRDNARIAAAYGRLLIAWVGRAHRTRRGAAS